MHLKPVWQDALNKKHDDYETVEVPINTQRQFGFATHENKQAYDETGDNRFMQSLTKMIILHNGEYMLLIN